jgi:hypothetical protein
MNVMVFINNLVRVPVMMALIGRNMLGSCLHEYIMFYLNSALVELTKFNLRNALYGIL